MAKTPTYPLGLPTEQRERWQKEAAKRGVSLAEFIRLAVERDIRLGSPPADDDGMEPIATASLLGGKVFKGPDPKIKGGATAKETKGRFR